VIESKSSGQRVKASRREDGAAFLVHKPLQTTGWGVSNRCANTRTDQTHKPFAGPDPMEWRTAERTTRCRIGYECVYLLHGALHLPRQGQRGQRTRSSQAQRNKSFFRSSLSCAKERMVCVPLFFGTVKRGARLTLNSRHGLSWALPANDLDS
jgi:hypothetical protein